MHYADPVHSRIKIMLELKDDQTIAQNREILCRLVNNLEKARAKYKKFVDKFELVENDGDVCLYKKNFTDTQETYSILIPTLDEELKLLMRCHKEEFHETTDNQFTLLRDML